MKYSGIRIIGLLFVSALFLQSCAADLRTVSIKKEGITDANTQKGKDLLESVWLKQGFDKMEEHDVYSFKGVDDWQGMLGRMGKLWPDLNTQLEFKYKTA